MTLVLAYANPEFVIIAADRKIRTKDGSFEDSKFTKSALLYNQYLASFTGLAQLGSAKHTMEWFVRTAAQVPDTIDLNHIADEATKAVRKVRADKESKRLAFLLVGHSPAGEIAYILITNMHADPVNLPDGREVKELPEARDKFIWVVETPPVKQKIRTIGWPMPDTANRNMLQRLNATHVTKPPSMDTVKDILAGAIEESAGDFISDTALITILKRGGDVLFDVVTPGSKPGQTVDLASPYILGPGGSIMVMPNQQLRRAKPAK